MKVKFFSGLDGQYTVFSNSPQSNYTNPFNVPNNIFYYELNLDYLDRTYYFKNLAGQVIQELTWYEYKNKV